jgi:hypothetical protein
MLQQNQLLLAQLQNQLGGSVIQPVIKSESKEATTTVMTPPGAWNLDDSSSIEVIEERSCKRRRTQPTVEVIDIS